MCLQLLRSAEASKCKSAQIPFIIWYAIWCWCYTTANVKAGKIHDTHTKKRNNGNAKGMSLQWFELPKNPEVSYAALKCERAATWHDKLVVMTSRVYFYTLQELIEKISMASIVIPHGASEQVMWTEGDLWLYDAVRKNLATFNQKKRLVILDNAFFKRARRDLCAQHRGANLQRFKQRKTTRTRTGYTVSMRLMANNRKETHHIKKPTNFESIKLIALQQHDLQLAVKSSWNRRYKLIKLLYI